MKRMPADIIQSKLAWRKDDYYDTTKKYYQPIMDIIVITEGYEGVEHQWKLTGAVSKKRGRYQKSVIHNPKIVFNGNYVDWWINIPQRQSNYYKNRRMKADQLMAYVCSYLQDEGMTTGDALNMFYKEWEAVAEVKKNES